MSENLYWAVTSPTSFTISFLSQMSSHLIPSSSILMKMSSQVVKDIGEIYTRLFDNRPFLSGEIVYFVREFEEKRQDREIEGLFTTLQNTIENRDSSIEKFRLASEVHLSDIKTHLDSVKSVLETALDDQPTEHLSKILEENRARRQIEWQQFVDDMAHKCARVDNTFEEKEEELRDFYTDLERKLHINN